MPSITPRMVGLYLFLFWIQCIVGVCVIVYNQILWQHAGNNLADTILQVILMSGAVGIGAATNSIVVVITVEGILVLAEWVKKKQFKEGVEVGKKQGIEQGAAAERKRANAKLRALAEEYGIPEEKLEIEEEADEKPN